MGCNFIYGSSDVPIARIDLARVNLYVWRRIRRVPTLRWRGGRVAEGGGLLNRYTVNPVSWVRIPSPPPSLLSVQPFTLQYWGTGCRFLCGTTYICAGFCDDAIATACSSGVR